MRRIHQLGGRVFWWKQYSHILSFARSILLMRLILPDAHGIFLVASTLVSYISFLRAFDFRAPIIAAKELNPRLLSTQFSAEVGVSALNLLLGLLLMPWIIGKHSHVIFFATIGLLIVNVIESAFSTPLYLTERNLKFPFLMRIRSMIDLASFIVCLTMAWFGFGIWALVFDRLVNSFLMFIIIWKYSDWKLSWGLDFDSIRYFFHFGGLLFIIGTLGIIIFGFDVLMNAKIWSKEVLGYYAKAQAYARLPMEIGSGFLSMMALALYSSESRRSSQSASQSYREMTFNISRISIWMSGVMVLLMNDLVPVVIGSNWIPMAPIFMAMLPYAIGRPLFQNAAQCITSLHEQKYFLLTIIILSPIYALVIIVLKGKNPIWVALASGSVLILGYIILEARVNQRLGGNAWKSTLAPLGLLTVVLVIFYGLHHTKLNSLYSLLYNISLATFYSVVAFLEWRWSNWKKPFQRPTS